MEKGHVMRYKRMYPALLAFAGALAAMGFLLDDPRNILPGLWKIIITEDSLITDYVQLAGPGAATPRWSPPPAY